MLRLEKVPEGESGTGRNPLELQEIEAGCGSLRANEEAPRPGLEPGTNRLTAGTKTIVSSGRTGTCSEPLDRVAARLPESVQTDPELARVVVAWPDLPAHIKAAVLALVGTAG
jgi:hypothetical protein